MYLNLLSGHDDGKYNYLIYSTNTVDQSLFRITLALLNLSDALKAKAISIIRD